MGAGLLSLLLIAADVRPPSATGSVDQGVAYLSFDAYITAAGDDKRDGYLEGLRWLVQKLDELRPCAWVLDLRHAAGDDPEPALIAFSDLPAAPVAILVSESTSFDALTIANALRSSRNAQIFTTNRRSAPDWIIEHPACR